MRGNAQKIELEKDTEIRGDWRKGSCTKASFMTADRVTIWQSELCPWKIKMPIIKL
jgi:hypothetical protein